MDAIAASFAEDSATPQSWTDSALCKSKQAASQPPLSLPLTPAAAADAHSRPKSMCAEARARKEVTPAATADSHSRPKSLWRAEACARKASKLPACAAKRRTAVMEMVGVPIAYEAHVMESLVTHHAQKSEDATINETVDWLSIWLTAQLLTGGQRRNTLA